MATLCAETSCPPAASNLKGISIFLNMCALYPVSASVTEGTEEEEEDFDNYFTLKHKFLAKSKNRKLWVQYIKKIAHMPFFAELVKCSPLISIIKTSFCPPAELRGRVYSWMFFGGISRVSSSSLWFLICPICLCKVLLVEQTISLGLRGVLTQEGIPQKRDGGNPTGGCISEVAETIFTQN